MGEPARVEDLARSTIQLMGLIVQDNERPDGDIAISLARSSGSERLSEMAAPPNWRPAGQHASLLIGDEPNISPQTVEETLAALQSVLEADDDCALRELLENAVRASTNVGADQVSTSP
jgi:FlaA1/EpsC-like NDP-sugar epimerase